MVYNELTRHFGSLSLETAYHHQQQQQQQHHHQQQQLQQLQQLHLGSIGSIMDPGQGYSLHQPAPSGPESPSTASSEIKSQNNQNAIVVPPEEAILKLCERTKYQIVQENGQRRYGPPPDWEDTPPNRGCEVFIGKIPRDCFEDELVPVFEKAGRIYMFRLMMDFSGSNRGYGFCIYTNREDTKRAVQKLDNYEIRRGKTLGVCLSVDNCRLFVGGIPKTKTKHEILVEMKKVTDGVRDVIVYPSAADKGKNRGFAFVEYEHHKAAAMARRKLIPGRIQLWGHQIAVDWAEPEREVDEDIMSKVKILYVRNLMLNTTEEHLRELFSSAIGISPESVERVKKIRDYAFVHFKDRADAIAAMEKLDDTEIDGSRVEVTLAKPVDKAESARAKTAAAAAAAAAAAGQQSKLQPLAQLITPQQAAGVGLYHQHQLQAHPAALHQLEPLALSAYCQGNGLLAQEQTGQQQQQQQQQQQPTHTQR